MKSKPVSPNSPTAGPATDTAIAAAPRSGDGKAAVRAPEKTVAVELEASRRRLVNRTILGIGFGALLVWKLGTVAVWTGWVLIALGVYRAYQLAMTFIYPAGTIEVSNDQIVLPRRIHRPHPLVVKSGTVTAVYFLRRSVPWNRAAPVLVVELDSRVILYPRDWFASEADQRQVIHALLAHRRPQKPKADAPHQP